MRWHSESSSICLSKCIKGLHDNQIRKRKFLEICFNSTSGQCYFTSHGRPIRAIGDRALILLLDKRIEKYNYSRCFPKDIRFNHTSEPSSTAALREDFSPRSCKLKKSERLKSARYLNRLWPMILILKKIQIQTIWA